MQPKSTPGEAAFLVWSDAFAVGHKGLDLEHYRLFAIIREIHESERAGRDRSQLQALLDAVKFVAIEHFRHENSVLRLEMPDVIDTAAINEHLAEHAAALAGLEAIIRGFRAGGDQLSFQLREWFVEHSVRYDAHLKSALRK
ncbi:MAG TPA: hemerythrin domain-containing protein [Rhizomicrobium sp.]|nr:hemerythrin domain-containing protein [Rhizomicrobium sp.]